MNGTVGRRIAVVLVPALVLILAWQVTPLKQLFEPSMAVARLASIQQAWWSPIAVVAGSVVACLLMAPLTLILIVHGALYDLPVSFLVAESAMLLAATALYATGWRAGEGIVDRALSPELRAQLDDLGAKGVIGLAALRWVPVAHFGLLSMSLGALRVPLSRFMLSTVIGQTPIVTMWVVLGDRVRMGLADANIRTLGLLFTAIITVLMVAVGMRLYARWRKMRIL